LLLLGAVLALVALPANTVWSTQLPGGFSPGIKPPIPPRSILLSDHDLTRFEKALAAADTRKWKKALSLVSTLSQPLPGKIILWRFLQSDDSKTSTGQIIDFVNANPDWPRLDRLLQRAEEEIPDDMPPRQVVALFAGQEPLTGKGKIRLGEAYAALGQEDYADYWIRDAWVHDDLTAKLESDILKKHSQRLTQETYAARVNRLLWDHKTTAARHLIRRLARDDRAVANARLSLMARGNIKRALASVPLSRRTDPGLVYEQVRLHRWAERDEQARTALRQAPADPALLVRPDKWWNERHILIRRAIKEEKYRDAYELASAHSSTTGPAFADAEWLAGWLALRFLHDPDLAETHFARLYDGVGYPISKARALYWRARAAEAAGTIERAAGFYTAASQYYMTFYGQLALEKLNAGQGSLVIPASMSVAPGTQKALNQRELVQALRLLSLTDQEKTLRVFLFHLADHLDGANYLASLSDLMRELGRPHLAVRVAKKASLRNIFLPHRAYPLTNVDLSRTTPSGAEPALILGLSRQESEFNPRAISRAGARGLMQLMPGTARLIARKNGMAYSRAKLLDDPSYNVALGSAHLGDLAQKFDGSYILAIASYNAGANRVRQWIQDYGDPRLASVDAIDWIEKIPFNETRNYVQRVLENTQIYRTYLAGIMPADHLYADLGISSGPSKISEYAMATPDLMVKKVAVDAPRRRIPAPRKKAASTPPFTLVSLTPDAETNPAPNHHKPGTAPPPSVARRLEPRPDLNSTSLPLRPMSTQTKEALTPFMEPIREAGDQTPKAVGTLTPPSPSSATKGCTLFIADSTGGGTCADLAAPASSPQRLTDLGQPDGEPEIQSDLEECTLFIPDNTGGGTCADLPQ